MSVAVEWSDSSPPGGGVDGQLNGRPPDVADQVGTPRVLERSGSPVYPADMRNSKKPKGDVSALEVDMVACDMEAEDVVFPSGSESSMVVVAGQGTSATGVKSMGQLVEKDSTQASTAAIPRVASYERVVTSKSGNNGWFADEQSLNTEDVVVLDEDCLEVVKTAAYKSSYPDKRSKNGRGSGAMNNPIEVVSLDTSSTLGSGRLSDMNGDGKDYRSNGVPVRSKMEHREPGALVISDWVKTGSNEINGLVASEGGMAVIGIRDMEENDPGG
ncbi:hypothetical protein V6N13_142030 [Hibiscus sabdariffa]|uniref:Uncharacterized protein n=1 Tax=Hibiscus sabdariffa TaxID=183260 RepID=A0ABR2FCV8_9ROSI